jgi:hypothetical protein
MVEHGICDAVTTGCVFGMLMVPVPSLMVLVASIRLEMNTVQDVMFSARSVACSPTKPSRKPSLSASTKASRSSRRDTRQSLSSGWIGIVKKPRFMMHRCLRIEEKCLIIRVN